jgi:hypothetical protein
MQAELQSQLVDDTTGGMVHDRQRKAHACGNLDEHADDGPKDLATASVYLISSGPLQEKLG